MPPPPSVGVAEPIERSLPVVREYTGVIETIESVQVMPRVGGLVVAVGVKNGAEVKTGDLLLQIDRQPYQVVLDGAVAALQGAQASLTNARSNLRRSQPLLAQHAISEQQLADLEAAARVAEANVAQARANVEAARLNLEWTRVQAPISGRIGKVVTTVGNLVVAGGVFPGTVITTLNGVDPLYVAFDLDEPTWRSIGQRLRASGSGGEAVPVDAAVAGETGFPHEGAIAFADNQIDTQSGSIRVRARVPNAERSLTPGAFARVRLEVSPPRPVLLIHENAVWSQLTNRMVYTVDANGITKAVPVVLGDQHGPLIEVESGLAAHDRVVVRGVAKIFFPGMPVAAEEVSMEQPDAPGDAGGTMPAAAPAAHSLMATTASSSSSATAPRSGAHSP